MVGKLGLGSPAHCIGMVLPCTGLSCWTRRNSKAPSQATSKCLRSAGQQNEEGGHIKRGGTQVLSLGDSDSLCPLRSPRKQEVRVATLPAATHQRREEDGAFHCMAHRDILKLGACISFVWIKMKFRPGYDPGHNTYHLTGCGQVETIGWFSSRQAAIFLVFLL